MTTGIEDINRPDFARPPDDLIIGKGMDYPEYNLTYSDRLQQGLTDQMMRDSNMRFSIRYPYRQIAEGVVAEVLAAKSAAKDLKVTLDITNALKIIEGIPGSLTLGHLRIANITRLPVFKNGKGESAHSQPDGSDWSLGDWMCAVTGELGESANIIKKVQRGDITMDDAREALKREFADVICYMDLLAYRCDIDLSDAVRTKFNEVSDRINCDIKL